MPRRVSVSPNASFSFAAELPSALAFLEFLRDRGASVLLRPSSALSRALEPDDDEPDAPEPLG